MDNKIKALSFAGITLFVIVILAKVIISFLTNNVIIENIRELQFIYGSNINVVEYFFHNYITLMKVEMIGLSIALIAGCILISTAFYLKIKRGKNRNPLFNKIVSIIYAVLNIITVFLVVLSNLVELPIVYTFICVLVLILISMIVMDLILTFIKKSKTVKRTIYFGISVASVVLLMIGVMIHFNNINTNIEKNKQVIDYHYTYITNYYSEYPDEIKDELVDKYMFMYYEMHSSKGYLIGLNYTTLSAYSYMIARDNEFSLTTDYTKEEKEIYEYYIEDETFNLPLLLSLLGGLIAVSFTVTIGEGTLASRKKKVNELIVVLLEQKQCLENNEITEEKYNEIKQNLFDNF